MVPLGDRPATVDPLPDGLAGDADASGSGAYASEASYDKSCWFKRHGGHTVSRLDTVSRAFRGQLGYRRMDIPLAKKRSRNGDETVRLLREWIEANLEKRGMSQAELAAAMGLDRQTIYKILRRGRKVSTEETQRLETIFDEPAPRLSPVPSAPKLGYLRVVGKVAAGQFLDVTYEHFKEYDTPYSYGGEMELNGVFGLVVEGESLNRQAKPGDVIVAVRLDHSPREFREGDYVVAEQTRGDLIETTVKVVRRGTKGWELWPDSDDPAHQKPVSLKNGGTVRVTAIVLDVIKRLTTL